MNRMIFVYMFAIFLLTGCQQGGHRASQVVFSKMILLHLPATLFEESNRHSIRVLPHTWVTLKRISVVLDDGTIIPCRDLQAGGIDLVRDTGSALLLGTLSLPKDSIKEVTVVLDRSAHCTADEGGDLSPCTLNSRVQDTSPSTTSTQSNETDLILRCRPEDSLASRSQLVIAMSATRTKSLPSTDIPISVQCSGTTPASIDTIQTPWISLQSSPEGPVQTLPYHLIIAGPRPSPPAVIKGSVQAETRQVRPAVVFTDPLPGQVIVCGTIVRLDIAKRTFQLRVEDSSDLKPYATLYFSLDSQAPYSFAGTMPNVPAGFEDISIGRRVWVRTSQVIDAKDRLNALEVHITDTGHRPLQAD